MYKSFFGLTESPFTIGPNPKFLYLSEKHKEAMAHLLYGVQGAGGFILLTGEVGTGKTTLCRKVLQQIPEDADVALILNPRATSLELLQYICDELRIEYGELDSIKVLNDKLNILLLKSYAKGRKTILIFDEAQQLSIEVLEQIRLLTNLETNSHKLLRIILIGQPELNAILSTVQLRQLAQRVTARYHLMSLNANEVEKYINNRLRVVGCQRQLFSASAIRKIHKHSRGIPRLINIICDRCLMGAFVSESYLVTPKLVKKAVYEVFGVPVSRSVKWYWVIISTLLILLVGALTALIAINQKWIIF